MIKESNFRIEYLGKYGVNEKTLLRLLLESTRLKGELTRCIQNQTAKYEYLS
jgi:hypothetical protein